MAHFQITKLDSMSCGAQSQFMWSVVNHALISQCFHLFALRPIRTVVPEMQNISGCDSCAIYGTSSRTLLALCRFCEKTTKCMQSWCVQLRLPITSLYWTACFKLNSLMIYLSILAKSISNRGLVQTVSWT